MHMHTVCVYICILKSVQYCSVKTKMIITYKQHYSHVHNDCRLEQYKVSVFLLYNRHE